MNGIKCTICPHGCVLTTGAVGFCRARVGEKGRISAENYGQVTAIALDPIEKKPLFHFYPGSKILSVGSYGCNFRCTFCQNAGISMAKKGEWDCFFMTPESLVTKALELRKNDNIGIAFTYNEPLIGYEYVYDTAKLALNDGLQTVVVTNGYINQQPLLTLLPFVSALNIDLKAFQAEFYEKIGGSLNDVQRTIALSAEQCHVEVTTLVIPGENDTEEEIAALAIWLASIDKAIPLHLTRFFPCHNMMNRQATSIEVVYRLAEIARQYLLYVYEGNC